MRKLTSAPSPTAHRTTIGVLAALVLLAAAVGCDESKATASTPTPTVASSAPAAVASNEEAASPAATRISTIYNVDEAPFEVLAVEHDASDNRIVTRIRNRSDWQIWNLSLSVRFLDERGEPVVESRANVSEGYYSFGGSSGPYICEAGQECVITWGSKASPIPRRFADAQLVPTSASSRPDSQNQFRSEHEWRLRGGPLGIDHPSVEASPNPPASPGLDDATAVGR